MSINYLDKTSDEWVQIWNDATGTGCSQPYNPALPRLSQDCRGEALGTVSVLRLSK